MERRSPIRGTVLKGIALPLSLSCHLKEDRPPERLPPGDRLSIRRPLVYSEALAFSGPGRTVYSSEPNSSHRPFSFLGGTDALASPDTPVALGRRDADALEPKVQRWWTPCS